MNHHLKQDDTPIERPAEKLFEPEQLRVFAQLPEDQKNTDIQESFVATAAEPALPTGRTQWAQWRDSWRSDLLRLSLVRAQNVTFPFSLAIRRPLAIGPRPFSDLKAGPPKVRDGQRGHLRLTVPAVRLVHRRRVGV